MIILGAIYKSLSDSNKRKNDESKISQKNCHARLPTYLERSYIKRKRRQKYIYNTVMGVFFDRSVFVLLRLDKCMVANCVVK